MILEHTWHRYFKTFQYNYIVLIFVCPSLCNLFGHIVCKKAGCLEATGHVKLLNCRSEELVVIHKVLVYWLFTTAFTRMENHGPCYTWLFHACYTMCRMETNNFWRQSAPDTEVRNQLQNQLLTSRWWNLVKVGPENTNGHVFEILANDR